MPGTPFLVPALLLALVLAVSAVAKLRVPADTASVMRQLRLPRVLFTIRAPVLLPYGELLLAALLLLLPGPAYVVATTLALVLFAAYLVVVARALTFGEPLMCGCFGRLGLGWITRQTLVRNVVLLALAVVAWVDSWRGHGVLQRLGELDRTGWWWLAAVAVAVVLTALVVRDGMPPTVTVEGIERDPTDYVTTPVPQGVLDGVLGPTTTWDLLDDAARLLVFCDLTDPSAATLAERAAGWQEALRPVVVHLVTSGRVGDGAGLDAELAQQLLGDPTGEVRTGLGVVSEPGAVLLGTNRLVVGGPAEGLADIEELVTAAAEELRAPTAG